MNGALRHFMSYGAALVWVLLATMIGATLTQTAAVPIAWILLWRDWKRQPDPNLAAMAEQLQKSNFLLLRIAEMLEQRPEVDLGLIESSVVTIAASAERADRQKYDYRGLAD